MIPLRIEGANCIFRAPYGAANVRDLHVRESDGCYVSRWEPTTDELEVLRAGGSIELWVMGNQPPVYLGVVAHVAEADPAGAP